MKATQAQQALIHTAISLGVSALLTIAGLVYQFVLGHGLDVPALLKFIGPVFLGQLSLIFLALRNNPNMAQAEADTINQALQGLYDKLDAILPFLHSHPVISAQPTPASTPTGLPPTPVVQLPFPATAPGAVTMTPAIRTTLNVPAVQSGQVQ